MRRILAILIVLLFAAAPAWADLRSSVEGLGTAKLDTLPDIIKSIAADTDPAAPKVPGALAEGTLLSAKPMRKCSSPRLRSKVSRSSIR